MRQQRFTNDQKRAAVHLSNTNIPLKEAAKRSGCSLASLMNWRRDSKKWVDRQGALAAPIDTEAAPNKVQESLIAKESLKNSELTHEIIILQFLIRQILEKLPQVLKLMEESNNIK